MVSKRAVRWKDCAKKVKRILQEMIRTCPVNHFEINLVIMNFQYEKKLIIKKLFA